MDDFRTPVNIWAYFSPPLPRQVNEEALTKFVEGETVTLERYRRAAARVPLPLKFDDNAQVRHVSKLRLSSPSFCSFV